MQFRSSQYIASEIKSHKNGGRRLVRNSIQSLTLESERDDRIAAKKRSVTDGHWLARRREAVGDDNEVEFCSRLRRAKNKTTNDDILRRNNTRPSVANLSRATQITRHHNSPWSVNATQPTWWWPTAVAGLLEQRAGAKIRLFRGQRRNTRNQEEKTTGGIV